jgi:hypothetical protein
MFIEDKRPLPRRLGFNNLDFLAKIMHNRKLPLYSPLFPLDTVSDFYIQFILNDLPLANNDLNDLWKLYIQERQDVLAKVVFVLKDKPDFLKLLGLQK